MRNKICNFFNYVNKGHTLYYKFLIAGSLLKGVIAQEKMASMIARATIKEDYIYNINKGSRDYRKTGLYKEFGYHLEDINGCFIDVGAHIGLVSVPAAKMNPETKVLSIEPDSDNYSLLKQNKWFNNADNITALKLAATSEEKQIEVYKAKQSYGTGSHSVEYEKDKHFKSEVVQGKPLDKIYSDSSIKDKVSLIKIDVEGHESEVLKGADKIISEHRPKIIFEARNQEKLQQVKDTLKEYDYKIEEKNFDYLAVP